jgi:hypothetical protein
VQNSINRDTLKGTRVSFFFASLTGLSSVSSLPQFVKTRFFGDADFALLNNRGGWLGTDAASRYGAAR